MTRSKSIKSMLGVGAAFAVLAIGAGGALAGNSANIEYDQNVTPEVIFGSGNANGGFTTSRRKGVEIGLRGKIRFPSPQNIFNSNGDGTYSFDTCTVAGSCPNAEWSFEWSINTDYEGTSGKKLSDYSYELGMDGNRGVGTSILTFDPIHLGPNGCADHSLGDNATANGGGAEFDPCPAGAAAYQAALGLNNVAQQSWRYGFFPWGPLAFFNPDEPGLYDIYLLAMNKKGKVVARSDIRILVGLPNGLPKHKSECKDSGWQAFNPLFESEKACKKFVKKNKSDEDDDDDDDDDED